MPPAVSVLVPLAMPRLPICPPLGLPVDVLADGLPLDDGVLRFGGGAAVQGERDCENRE
jgi:hypothetical protein